MNPEDGYNDRIGVTASWLGSRVIVKHQTYVRNHFGVLQGVAYA